MADDEADDEGSRRAFAREVVALRPRLVAAAMKVTGGQAAEAEDLAQDTVEKGIKAFARWRDGNLASWLVTILHRLYIDRLRARRRRVEVPLVDHDAPSVVADADEESRWQGIASADLWAAVGELDADFARVFRLHAEEGRSYDEIAAVLGIPRNTVGTRLLRARRKLKDILMRRRPS